MENDPYIRVQLDELEALEEEIKEKEELVVKYENKIFDGIEQEIMNILYKSSDVDNEKYIDDILYKPNKLLNYIRESLENNKMSKDDLFNIRYNYLRMIDILVDSDSFNIEKGFPEKVSNAIDLLYQVINYEEEYFEALEESDFDLDYLNRFENYVHFSKYVGVLQALIKKMYDIQSDGTEVISRDEFNNFTSNVTMYRRFLRQYKPLEPDLEDIDYESFIRLGESDADDIAKHFEANRFSSNMEAFLESFEPSNNVDTNNKIPLLYIRSLLNYQQGADSINPYAYLRKETLYDDTHEDSNSGIVKIIHELDSLIHYNGAINNVEMTLYRGLPMGLYDDIYKAFKNDDEYVNPTYMSTSDMVGSALSFNDRFVEIVLPPDLVPSVDVNKVLGAYSHYQSENEILLPRNIKFKLTMDEGRQRIVMTAMGMEEDSDKFDNINIDDKMTENIVFMEDEQYIKVRDNLQRMKANNKNDENKQRSIDEALNIISDRGQMSRKMFDNYNDKANNIKNHFNKVMGLDALDDYFATPGLGDSVYWGKLYSNMSALYENIYNLQVSGKGVSDDTRMELSNKYDSLRSSVNDMFNSVSEKLDVLVAEFSDTSSDKQVKRNDLQSRMGNLMGILPSVFDLGYESMKKREEIRNKIQKVKAGNENSIFNKLDSSMTLSEQLDVWSNLSRNEQINLWDTLTSPQKKEFTIKSNEEDEGPNQYWNDLSYTQKEMYNDLNEGDQVEFDNIEFDDIDEAKGYLEQLYYKAINKSFITDIKKSKSFDYIVPKNMQVGLGFKDKLPYGQGMLFILPIEKNMPMFTMDNMRFPLDFVCIDRYDKINHIEKNVFPRQGVKLQFPESKAVLEVNAGESNGLNIGDIIVFKDKSLEFAPIPLLFSIESSIMPNIKKSLPVVDKFQYDFDRLYNQNNSEDESNFMLSELSLLLNILNEGYNVDKMGYNIITNDGGDIQGFCKVCNDNDIFDVRSFIILPQEEEDEKYYGTHLLLNVIYKYLMSKNDIPERFTIKPFNDTSTQFYENIGFRPYEDDKYYMNRDDMMIFYDDMVSILKDDESEDERPMYDVIDDMLRPGEDDNHDISSLEARMLYKVYEWERQHGMTIGKTLNDSIRKSLIPTSIKDAKLRGLEPKSGNWQYPVEWIKKQRSVGTTTLMGEMYFTPQPPTALGEEASRKFKRKYINRKNKKMLEPENNDSVIQT